MVVFQTECQKNIKLTRGNIDKRKNLYLCAFVKNKDTRTEEHKANTMKNNQINICHSAHPVLLSKKNTKPGELLKLYLKDTLFALIKDSYRIYLYLIHYLNNPLGIDIVLEKILSDTNIIE